MRAATAAGIYDDEGNLTPAYGGKEPKGE